MEPDADLVPEATRATAHLREAAPESPNDGIEEAEEASTPADTCGGHMEQMYISAMQQRQAGDLGGSDTSEPEPEAVDPELEEADTHVDEIAPMADEACKGQELERGRRPTPSRRERSSLCNRLHAEHAEKLKRRQQQRDAIARKADEEFQELQSKLSIQRHASPATLRLRDKISGKINRYDQNPGKTDAKSDAACPQFQDHPWPEQQAEADDCEPEGRETSTSEGETLGQACRVPRARAKVLLYSRKLSGNSECHSSDGIRVARINLQVSPRSPRRALRTSSCPPRLQPAPPETVKQRRYSFELDRRLRAKLELARSVQLSARQAHQQQDCGALPEADAAAQQISEFSILAGELLSQAAEVIQDMEYEAAAANNEQGTLMGAERAGYDSEEAEQRGEASQPSAENSVFDRLHAAHAEKLLKLQSKREDKARQADEELREARSKSSKRSASAVREKDREPVFEKLHALASEQSRKRTTELERQEKVESQWLERNSVHRHSDPGALPRFDRLHEDYHQRQQRLENRREDLVKNFFQDSVHAHVPRSPAAAQQVTDRLYKQSAAREERLKQMREAATSEIVARAGPKRTTGQAGPDRTEILYENAMKRKQERLEQQRKKEEEEQAAKSPIGRKRMCDGQARSENLYKDADRRNKERQEQQRRARMEEYERYQHESIHSTAQRRQAWVTRKPLSGSRSSTSLCHSPSGVGDVDVNLDDFHDKSWIGEQSPIPCQAAYADSQICDSILDILKDEGAAVDQKGDGDRPSLESFGTYVNSLRDNGNLRDLVLNGLGLNSDHAEALAEAIGKNASLQHLDLAGNHIGPAGGRAIAKALLLNSSIERLDLCGNGLGSEGGQALAEPLRGNCTIRHLDLGMNCLGPEDGCLLAEVLSQSQTVQELHLSCNELGSDGALFFASMIKENTSVQVLNLSNNRIDAVGGGAVAQALLENCTLRQLDFNGNDLGVDGGRAFADVLVKNPSIQHLCLSGNMVGAEGGLAFAEVLRRNCILQQLDLSMNALGGQGAQAIAEALKDNQILEHLDLGFNKFGDEGGQAFAEACTRNHNLQHLDLTSNHIGSCVGRAWSITVEVNRGLQRLLLQGNDIPAKDLAALEAALAFNQMPDRVVTLRAALFNVDDEDLELSCTSAGGEELARVHVVPDQDCLGKVRRAVAEQLKFPVRKLQLILPDGKHLAQIDDGVPFIEMLGQDRNKSQHGMFGHASGSDSSGSQSMY